MKVQTGALDRKTGLPLNTEGDVRMMRYLDVSSYEYSEMVSLLVNQVADEYKRVFNGSQIKTIKVVGAVMHQLLMTELPLRISKTTLCSSNTMKDITDRLGKMYPRLFKCLRGYPTRTHQVPSIIAWNYGVRELFMKAIAKHYHSKGKVLSLVDYVPSEDEDLLEKRYLANKEKIKQSKEI